MHRRCPNPQDSCESFADLFGNSGATSEIFRLIFPISSSRPVLSMSRMMACAANMVERRGRRRQFDPGRSCASPVLECDTRRGIGRRHGAVDCGTRGLAHLLEEGRLDRFFPRRQHEFEFGTDPDLGADRPGRAVYGMDRGQVGRQDQAVEVQVGLVPVAATPREDAEGEAPPGFGMDGVHRGRPGGGGSHHRA